MTRLYASKELVWDHWRLRLGPRGRVLATVVQDSKYPSMYRVLLPDGTLTDMVNFTRARDAAKHNALSALNEGSRNEI